jgi:uncharacterized sulfatase
MRTGIKQKLRDGFRGYLPFVWVLLLMQFLFRLFEFLAAAGNAYDIPFSDFAIGFLFDMLFAFSFAALIFPLYLLLFIGNRKIADVFTGLILLLTFLSSYGLERYFTTVFYPLDKVFFSYSLQEILLIGETGGRFDIGTVLVFLLMLSVLVISYYLLKRRRFPLFVQSLTLVLMVVSSTLGSAIIKNSQKKCPELCFQNRINKTDYFMREAFSYFYTEKVLDNQSLDADVVESFRKAYPGRVFSSGEYPLLYTADTASALSPFFRKGAQPPNFVFIIVESLTRCYSGPGAWAGSYTPFLDSLMRHSLYWTDFTSTSERTVGVLPGIFGSLPSAKEGFAALGGKMPLHLSLINILEKNHYRTEFFYGGEPSFDNTNVFLSRQGLGMIQSGTYYKKDGQVFWGLNDSLVYAKSLDYRDRQEDKQPFLSIYLTLSTHGPFDFPGRKSIERFLLDDWSKGFNEKQKKHLKKYLSKLASYYYTDAQIRNLFYGLKARGKLDNTIFIVTGDHGVVQVCTENPVKRYHVPLLIYSPLLKRPKTMAAINSHYNITPSVLSYLHQQYDIELPGRVHWLGGELDTTDELRSRIPVPIMQLNRSVEEVLYGDYFLSKGKLYRAEKNMAMHPEHNDSLQNALQAWLDAYLRINRYVCDNNRLIPLSEYRRWGNVYALQGRHSEDRVFIDSATDYISLWKQQIATNNGNYRIEIDFELLPNNVDPTNYPYFVLDLSDEDGNKIYYNSMQWVREGSVFDTAATNSLSLSLETFIPENVQDKELKLNAYLWNNKHCVLDLKNLEVKIYRQQKTDINEAE